MTDLFITIWPSVDRPAEGKTYRTTPAALAASMSGPREYPSKGAVPRLALATFDQGYRCNEALIAAYGLVVDVDAPSFAAVAAALPFRTILHTTWSGGVRAFVMIDRSITMVEEYRRASRYLLGFLERAGITPDYASLVPSQPWAVPAMRPGYRFAETRGTELDVSEALRVIPPEEKQPIDAGPKKSPPTAYERATKWIAKAEPAVSGQNGSTRTFWVATALVRGFSLSDDDALSVMQSWNLTCDPPWSTWDLKRKIREARARGRKMAFGELLEKRRAG